MAPVQQDKWVISYTSSPKWVLTTNNYFDLVICVALLFTASFTPFTPTAQFCLTFEIGILLSITSYEVPRV